MTRYRDVRRGAALFASALIAMACGGREPQADWPKSEAPAAAARLDPKPLPNSAFSVGWGAPEPPVPPTMSAGQRMAFTIVVTNVSDQTWSDPIRANSPGGAYAVRLGYRWLAKNKQVAVVDYGDRVDLPKAIAPGESVPLSIEVMAPGAPGEYRLQFDLVQELHAWFEGKGASKLIFPVAVHRS